MDTKKIALNKIGTTKVIVMGDTHLPYEDKDALSLVEKYMASEKWDIYINLGDLLDLDCISFFNKGRPGLIEGKNIADDFRIGNEVLDRHQKIIRKNNKQARFAFIGGNHDSSRLRRLIEEMPQLRGTFDLEKNLHLKDRKFIYVENAEEGSALDVGNARFIHGFFPDVSRHIPEFFSKQMAIAHGKHVFSGHSHDVQSIPVPQYGEGTSLIGQSLGCLCKYDQAYMKGRPSRWQQAFGVFFFLPDGSFNHYVVRINKNGSQTRFISPDGRVYSCG